jgi:apolipoprotein N-acyltransferase
MACLSALMLTAIFPPFYCIFFAPFCLVPLCVCILRRPLNWRYLLLYYFAGSAFFVPNLFWLYPVTKPGFILLGMYIAVYFPIFAFGLHRLVNGLRVPATIAVPLVWTAVEFVRATFLEGGFPWFLLGNSFAAAPLFIQIADLFGVWGVTFFIALVNGFVVDVLRLPLRREGKFNPAIGRLIAATSVMIAFVIGYGVHRLGQRATTPGPRMAVIQENIPQSVKSDPEQKMPNVQKHVKLTRQAAAERPVPDLIAWPETMVPVSMNEEFLNFPQSGVQKKYRQHLPDVQAENREAKDALQRLANELGTSLLIGAEGWFPNDGPIEGWGRENQTLLFTPQMQGVPQRYAKRHLVPFGEYIPFLNFPLVGKYMIHISPYENFDYSLRRGAEWTRFTLPAKQFEILQRGPSTATAASQAAASGPAPTPGGEIMRSTKFYRFATPICFEDTMPNPARRMTAPQFGGGVKTDFLINVSNDGWFFAAELDQHLQACQLRAVENRVPIARAVNTGDSGFIDSCGRIIKLIPVHTAGTASWTLEIDSRVTLFSQVGDILPIICGIAAVLGTGWTIVRPRRGPKPLAVAEELDK